MGVRTVRIKAFAKHNAVMLTAFAAAAVTVLFVPVDSAYAGYLDMKTLICLFCVLAVVCALGMLAFSISLPAASCGCLKPAVCASLRWYI